MAEKKRCAWVGDEPIYRAYHDKEWGVPCRDDWALFELLILEGAQAGLSWITILKKRDNYRRLFDNFDAAKIARYTPKKIERLLQDPGIVRNRLKVESTVINARAFLDLQREPGGFSGFIWSFVDGEPIRNHPCSLEEVPVSTAESDALSKALKKRGFKFVGTTICYAFMQAAGLVDDHTIDCFRHSPP
ncbi:MAG: DNA-3-methyladenine glycosylase I [Chromatiales bacterium]|jgi:DNA-3-methyladenine glycosylase I